MTCAASNDGIAEAFVESWTSTATIRRPSPTEVDADGNPTDALTITASAIAASLLTPRSSVRLERREVAGQTGQRTDRVLLVPLDTDVRAGDQATVRGEWKIDAVEELEFYIRCEVHRVER